MENYVEGKVVLITGAASQVGFGKNVAEIVTSMGGKVVAMDIDGENLNKTAEGIRAAGGEIVCMTGDASKEEDVKKFVKLALDTYGRVDTFVANAGTMPHALFKNYDIAIRPWEKVIDLSLKGTLYAIGACYDVMQKQGYGQMIFVSSIMANFSFASSCVYSAVKEGIRYIANGLRQEAHGVIKVTVVNPPSICTTNLAKTIVAPGGGGGPMIDSVEYMTRGGKLMRGEAPAEFLDRDSIRYWELTARDLAEQIVYCINQPAGISISDITVRSGDDLFII